jgi:uncharacterized protein with von Willebrand factor type A (vWA) domain
VPATSNAFVRLLDELLWVLRREGFSLSTAQAIDAARAVEAVGLGTRAAVRDAVAAVVVQRAADLPRFGDVFDAFFAAGGSTDTRGLPLWDRLAARGFTSDEIAALRELLEQLASTTPDGTDTLGMLLARGADLDRALAVAGIARSVDAHSGPQMGFVAHRLLSQLGVPRARSLLSTLRARLTDALGDRGNGLADALAEELDRASEDIRAHVRRTYEMRVAEREQEGPRLQTMPFASLSDAEIEEVRRAIRRFAHRLRGSARVRARRAVRGRLDPHRTLRRALRTAGVPFSPAYRDRRRDRPRLVLLCDVSDSVRAAAGFLLEFTYAAQDLFERARSFVFVSQLGETTQLFAREPARVAIAHAWGGGVVAAGDNSNYGRVLRTFESQHLRELDRRTTVVILGDGRSNYHDPAADVLPRIRARARALLWLCPEKRGQWGQGDSMMGRYAPQCTAVYEVACAADLERAVRVLVRGA